MESVPGGSEHSEHEGAGRPSRKKMKKADHLKKMGESFWESLFDSEGEIERRGSERSSDVLKNEQEKRGRKSSMREEESHKYSREDEWVGEKGKKTRIKEETVNDDVDESKENCIQKLEKMFNIKRKELKEEKNNPKQLINKTERRTFLVSVQQKCMKH